MSQREATPQALFDRVAPRYDALNSTLSFGMDRRWRGSVAQVLAQEGAADVLDVACGTGALGREVAKLVSRPRLVGVDLNERMLSEARKRGAAHYRSLVRASVESLPFADDSFDAVIVAFAFHDFLDQPRAAAEIARVLRPGGSLVDLELTLPTVPALRRTYTATLSLLSAIGRLRGLEGYSHLREEVTGTPDDAHLIGVLEAAGFTTRDVKHLSGGLTTRYHFVREGAVA